MLIGADAALGGVGTWAALTALAHLSAAGPAYLRLAPEYDPARRIGEIHLDLVEYAVVSFVGLILLAPLAFAVRRAWPAARVAAWTAGIVETIGSLIVLAGGPDELVSPDGIESPAVGTALENLLPGWYLGATSVLTAAELALTVAFCVMLFRTSAADFYGSGSPQGPEGLWRRASRPDG